MKKIFTLAFISLAAACLAVSCNEKDEPTESLAVAIVSLTGDSYFADNQATVTAKISQPLDKDVTVTLGPGYVTTATKYAIIDDEDLSYSSLVIPAGQTEVSGTVTVDPTEYTDGRYQAQICIAAVDGAMVAESASTVNISLLNGSPVAFINFTNNYFADDGTGSIVVSLSMPSDYESTVTLEYEDLSSDFGLPAIPEDAVIFEKEVVIAADKDEAKINVTVDLDKLTASGTFVAGFKIVSVSDNISFDEDKCETFAGLDFILPVANEAWTAEYSDIWTSPSSGDTYDEVYVDGVDADQYYICERFPKGTYDNDAYISSVLANVNLPGMPYPAYAYVGAGYTVAQLTSWGYINQGPDAWEFDHDDAGEYDVYVIALDAETGEFTGEYSVSTVEFADASLLLQWSGDWKLGEDTEISFIPYSLAYEEVLITGIEGASYVVADFDPETGDIAVSGQQVAKNVYLLPNIVYGGALDLAFVIDTISKISMTGEGEASASAEPVDDGTGTLFMGAGMSVYDLAASETISYIELPATLVKVVDTEPTAVAGKDGGKLTPRERKPAIVKDTTPLTL